VDEEVQRLSEQMKALGSAKTREALAAAGITIPGPGDIPDKAWDKMSGWQVLLVLLVMFVAIIGIFVLLLVWGVDLATAKNAGDTKKTLGTTLVGAALGMIGATAVSAGSAIKR
jgi:hypothetical protein